MSRTTVQPRTTHPRTEPADTLPKIPTLRILDIVMPRPELAEVFEKLVPGARKPSDADPQSPDSDRKPRMMPELRPDQIRFPFMDSSEFRDPANRAKILKNPPYVEEYLANQTVVWKSGNDMEIDSMFTQRLLTKDLEQFFFRKMNYLKYPANREEPGSKPEARYVNQAMDLRDLIVRANLRLAWSCLKKYQSEHRSPASIMSDGSLSIMKSVEKFDYMTRYKFSTYATWALTRNAWREYSTQAAQAGRFSTNIDDNILDRPMFDEADGINPNHTAASLREGIIEELFDCLNERQKDVLKARLLSDTPPTLDELAAELGITKERVRQIQVAALKKVRAYAAEEFSDAEIEERLGMF